MFEREGESEFWHCIMQMRANALNKFKSKGAHTVHVLFGSKRVSKYNSVYHQSLGGYTLYNGLYQQAFLKETTFHASGI